MRPRQGAYKQSTWLPFPLSDHVAASPHPVAFINTSNFSFKPKLLSLLKAMTNVLSVVCLGALVASVSSQCTGLDDPACPSWAANGYCTNEGHPMEERKKYCGVYCGFCNLDGSQTAAGGGDTLEPCDDANANCVTWNDDPTNNFCNRTDYSSSMKLLYCCKTCRPYVLD